MSNYVLTRPSFVGYCTSSMSYALTSGNVTGSTAALSSSAVNSLGSVRELTFETTAEILKATSNAYNDATVAAARGSVAGTMTVQLEEITSSAMMLIWGASGNSSAFSMDMAASTITYYGFTSGPWYIDGSAFALALTKCVINPTATRKVGKEQEILELKFDVLVDVDASAGKKFARFLGQS